MKTLIKNCIDCGEEITVSAKGRTLRCDPCRKIYHKVYSGLYNKSYKRKEVKIQEDEESAMKRGHLEVFMGTEFGDQII